MTDADDFILTDCPQHGAVHHNYDAFSNSFVCRISRCRHFVTDESVSTARLLGEVGA